MASAGPRKRAAFAMAYDSHRSRVVLFGGLWIDGQYADLWQWTNGSWERQGGAYDNSSLDHHAMVYDAAGRRLIIFGGKNYRNDLLASTRTVDDNKKVRQLSAEGPSARHSLGLTYDSRRGRVILYGGKVYQGDLQLPLSDHWRWDGERWHRIRAAGADGGGPEGTLTNSKDFFQSR